MNNLKVIFYLRAFFAVLALLAFCWLFITAFRLTNLAVDTPPEFSEPFTIAASGLAGLIGGAAAIGLGTNLPDRSKFLSSPKITQRFYSLGKWFFPFQPEQLQLILSILYVLVYSIVCITGWITWLSHPDTTPDLVKDISGIFMGLIFAVVQSFFGINKTPEIKKRH